MRTGSMRVAEISMPAVRHNVGRIRELTGGFVIAVVKANGYGHGAADVARAAFEGGAGMVATADLEEALALREAGISGPLLCWIHGIGVDFISAITHDIEIGVNNLDQLEKLAAAANETGKPAVAQLKIDTGLSRNGAARADWDTLFARAAELHAAGTVHVRGIFSHLANAGAEADRAQAAVLDDAVASLRSHGIDPELIHLAASAATLSSPHLHYTAVRVGIMIYGLSPVPDKTSADLGLVPAMTLRSEVIALRDVPAGTGVSYGFNHICETATTLALVPMGYADGMPRALNGAGAGVSIGGQQRPIVGRIGMDQCIVDVGPQAAHIKLGDRVVLFGDPEQGYPPVETWAKLMHTINYEIVVGIGSRVLRIAAERADETPQASAAETIERIEVSTPDAMHELGVALGRVLDAGDLLILTGPLGAGKTTLTRGIGEGLGVRGPVQSPTFVIARTHPSLGGGAPLVHVDAYRLANADELDDLDLDFEGSVVVAEWGAGVVEPTGSWIEIEIHRPTGAGDAGSTGSDDGSAAEDEADGIEDWSEALVEARQITLTGHGPRWAGGIVR